MWQCGACEYWNDEWDETCRNCNAGRISKDQPESSGTAVPADGVTKAEASTPKLRRFGVFETVITGVIIVCVLALGYLGYIYYSKGQVNLDLKLPTVKLPKAGPGSGQDTGFDPRTTALETDHSLAALYSAETREVRPLYPFADTLIATEYALETIDRPKQDEAAFSTAGLDKLEELTDNLVVSYEEFEAVYDELDSIELASYAQLLRTVYALRFDDIIMRVGEFYIVDDEGVHQAYMLSDELPAVLEKYDPDLALQLIKRWGSVNFDRSQRQLDATLTAEIGELNGWAEAMMVLHKGFQTERGNVPPYGVRNGIIDPAAKQTLDLLNELLNDIELLTTGFEEYRAGIGDLSRSDRIKNLCRTFTDMAQTDHLYAFEEIYKIYAQDRSLSYPVYEELKAHYNFAIETWPNQEVTYRGVFITYENEWADRWVNQ